MTPPPRLPWLAVVLLAAACSTAPLAVVPDPYREHDGDWALPERRGAFLGATVRENDSRSLEALFFEPGVRVIEVVENSPAAAAGLAVGDVVLGLDGVEVDTPETLDALLLDATPGARATLRTRRGDALFELEVTLGGEGGAPADVRRLATVDPARTRAGWRTVTGGVELATVAADSPLGEALAVGSVVVAVDGEPVRSARALVRRVQAAAPGASVDFDLADGTRTRLTLAHAPRVITRLHVPFLYEYEASPDGADASLAILDFWVFAIFEYERSGAERRWRLLELFEFATGVGELAR